MSKRFYGSINFDALLEAIKSGKVRTFKADNGTRYINYNMWLNDHQDKFGNDGSIQLVNKKEFQDEKNVYISNFKEAEAKEITEKDAAALEVETDDFPF